MPEKEGEGPIRAIKSEIGIQYFGSGHNTLHESQTQTSDPIGLYHASYAECHERFSSKEFNYYSWYFIANQC